jgi:hypothetical protein
MAGGGRLQGKSPAVGRTAGCMQCRSRPDEGRQGRVEHADQEGQKQNPAGLQDPRRDQLIATSHEAMAE